MKISESFINSYLTVDGTSDNYVFENCPREFVSFAYSKLNVSSNGHKNCVVLLLPQEESIFREIMNQCENPYERRILAQYYVNTRIMQSIYHGRDNDSYLECSKHLTAFYERKMWQIKCNYKQSVIFPYDLIDAIKRYGKFDICVFFDDHKEVELQRAFNNLLLFRLPVGVKFFSNKRLISSLDASGTMIQSPHDFISIDVNKFIENEETESSEQE